MLQIVRVVKIKVIKSVCQLILHDSVQLCQLHNQIMYTDNCKVKNEVNKPKSHTSLLLAVPKCGITNIRAETDIKKEAVPSVRPILNFRVIISRGMHMTR